MVNMVDHMDRCVPVSVNGIMLNMVAPLDRCVPVSVNGIMLNMVAPLDRCVPVSVKGIMLNMVAPLDRCVPVDVNGILLNMVAPLGRFCWEIIIFVSSVKCVRIAAQATQNECPGKCIFARLRDDGPPTSMIDHSADNYDDRFAWFIARALSL